MIYMLLGLCALFAVVSNALAVLAVRHRRLELQWADTCRRAWRAEAAAETAQYHLAQALQRVEAARDSAALYKTQLTAGQLANLRALKGKQNDVEKTQRVGSLVDRIRASRRVLNKTIADSEASQRDYGDENTSLDVCAPAAASKGASD